MKTDEFEAITETIREAQYDDRGLIPECFNHALNTLREIATGPHWASCDHSLVLIEAGLAWRCDCPVNVAVQALRRMALRATSGVPFPEPPHTEEHL